MVLVDTSVWIRFLIGREPYASGLDDLLTRDEVLGHDLVYGELLVGDRGGRSKLLAGYAAMHRATTIPHAQVVGLVKDREIHGRGIGWVDAHLLASALVESAELWTADSPLEKLAVEIGVAHRR